MLQHHITAHPSAYPINAVGIDIQLFSVRLCLLLRQTKQPTERRASPSANIVGCYTLKAKARRVFSHPVLTVVHNSQPIRFHPATTRKKKHLETDYNSKLVWSCQRTNVYTKY